MQNLTSKWKSLNKNGLKLSLICSLNWLIVFIAKAQFFIFSVMFLGTLTYYLPRDYRIITVNLVELFVMAKVIIDFVQMVWSQEFRRFKSVLNICVLLVFFVAGTKYAAQYTVTERLVTDLCNFMIMSAIFQTLVTFLQPRLFKRYIFKNIINKEYLGIRKLTDDLPPEINFYTDAAEADADKRMRQINKNVIKQPYQDIVQLSFVNRKIITGIHHKIDLVTKEKEQNFEDVDTIYYPVFKVYPFGIDEEFWHTLIQFKLSRKAAFTKSLEGQLGIKY
ncbi:hypothetical protein [Streptococcus anginosus]|uniref:hypothetical protein n=1 Tax=Streptococcus anginosus TaxID=1328 RepID=UPI0039C241E2